MLEGGVFFFVCLSSSLNLKTSTLPSVPRQEVSIRRRPSSPSGQEAGGRAGTEAKPGEVWSRRKSPLATRLQKTSEAWPSCWRKLHPRVKTALDPLGPQLTDRLPKCDATALSVHWRLGIDPRSATTPRCRRRLLGAPVLAPITPASGAARRASPQL